ncbi:neutral/alkaline non-lysosomal ceramidase N-terminal domain-containing protein [Thalassoglobus sp. JC818]|uniref:neutral/alkaline non-lysosomal ceramidase N-terminal domain-containing protein n=1 Tax=Thalassoglobus sp. JC818 TaxID=3232136 RepID=UPI0034580FB2
MLRRCSIACVCVVLCLATTVRAEDRVFLAGAATSNITPPLGELIVGGWAPIPCTHIHDELHARCLILNDGETTLGFVICDNVGIPREVFDAAREQIAEQTDLNVDNILMASTHTHSATTARGRSKTEAVSNLASYQEFLAQRITDCVRRALNQMVPARIGWGSVEEASELFNRRWYVTDPDLLTNPFGGVDKVRMNPPRGSATLVRPAGPVDPEVSFIAVESKEGKPLALLANYSLHYVGGVQSGEVSADYFGIFADLLQRHFDPEAQYPRFVGMMTNGTSGDVNNINFTGKRPSREPYEQMQIVAEKLAKRVIAAYTEITWNDYVELGSAKSTLQLQVRQPTPEMKEYFTSVMDLPEKERHRHVLTYIDRIKRIESGPQSIEVPLQVIRIGDLAVHAIPFEVFTEIGLELKDRSPFDDAFTIELANGSYGYLPTPAQHELGGYETWLGTNNVQLDASEKIVDQLLDLSQSLTPSE